VCQCAVFVTQFSNHWGFVPQFDIILKAHDLLHATAHMTQLDANPDSAPEKGETMFCTFATPADPAAGCIKETAAIKIRESRNPNTMKIEAAPYNFTAPKIACIAAASGLTDTGKLGGEKPSPNPISMARPV
jgi:hypothetical protein